MDWKGFSSDEIKNLQKKEIKNFSEDLGTQDNVLEELATFTNCNLTECKISKIGSSSSSSNIKSKSMKSYLKKQPESNPQYPILESAKLNKKEKTMKTQLQPSETTNLTNLEEPPKKPVVTIVVCEDKSYEVLSNSSEMNDNPLSSGYSSLDCSNSILSNQNGQLNSSLELFQERQKQMEEQNKRRRELLSKAIADRKRQTQFEAKKLLQIQEELTRLDAILSTDVEILRNQIEVAASEFNEAQKRYDRAENEFIQAKLFLFGKLERKELLTEHLCRIIEVNEQRKAKKLSELMVKLEITEEVGDTCQEVLSLHSNLDEISYAVCNTLKDPNKSLKNESLNNTTKIESLQGSVPNLIKNNLCGKEDKESVVTTVNL